MIGLTRIGMVNWHQFPHQDIDIEGNVALVGENRSGKSTLLDLIQTVMSGNGLGKYLELNARAGGGKRKGRRSVQAYILGRTGDGPEGVKRPEAQCVLFLTFERSDGWPVTLGVVMEARVQDAKESTRARFIADGVKLSVKDLVDRPEGSGEEGGLPKDWDAVIRPWLESACVEAGGQLIAHPESKAATHFVGDYLKLLSTGRLPIPPERFLKAFGNAARLKDISSVNDFVRDFILEKDDVRIDQLRDSIRDYRGYAREITLLRKKLDHLKPLAERIEAHARDLRLQDITRWGEARAKALSARIAMGRHQRLAREGLEKQAVIRADLERVKREWAELEAERKGLERLINAASETQRMTELRGQQGDLERASKDAFSDIQGHYKVVVDLVNVLLAADIIPPNLGRILEILRLLREQGGADQPPRWPKDPHAVEGLLGALCLERERLMGSLETAVDALTVERAEVDGRVKELSRQIEEITRRGFSIRPEVEALREDLRRMGIPSRLLCERLEVVDEGWRLALEVLLGRDREAILVDREYVETAIRHLQDNRQTYRGCRVANSRKLTERGRGEPGTLASVVRSDDPLAMAFVLRRIGNVRLAETITDLHAEGRAIMRDGTYDDGLAVEVRQLGRNDGHKIGANAGRSSLRSLERDRDGLRARSAELEKDRKRHGSVLLAFRGLEGWADRPGLGQAVDRFERVRDGLEEIARAMAEERDRADPAYVERLALIDAQLDTYREEEIGLNQALVLAKRDVEGATSRLSGGEQEVGSKYQVKVLRGRYLGLFSTLGPIRTLGGREHFLDVVARRGGKLEAAAVTLGAEREKLEKHLAGEAPEILRRYVEYTRLDEGSPVFDSTHSIHGDLRDWVVEQITTIEANSLQRYEDLAKKAAERAEFYFQHAFIHELRERFSRVEEAVDSMSQALKDHPFHNERYRFFHEPSGDHRAVWDLVQRSREDDSLLLPLFQEAEITKEIPHGEALLRVRDLLLSSDVEVEVFADYRNYFVFDLEMIDIQTKRRTNLESRQGTGSGAEQQTPYYVAIGASLATLYHRARHRVGTRGVVNDPGLGLVILDEAFSNMDPKNVWAAFEYYRDLGLQLIVAAPYDKRAVLLEKVETVVDIWRDGDYADTETSYPGARLREELARRNPAHYDMDDFRRFVEARSTSFDDGGRG